MRVALAHKLYQVTGGAEVFFHETDRVLRERGIQTLKIATGEPSSAADGENVLMLQAPAYDRGGILSKIKNAPSVIYDIRKKNKIKTALTAFEADILHVFSVNVHLSPSVVVAAAELDIPIVGTFNDYKHICPNYKLFHHGKVCFDCKGERFYKAIANKCCKDNRALSAASAVEAYVHKFMNIYDNFDHFTFSSDFLAETTARFWPDRDFTWSKLRNPFESSKFKVASEYLEYGLYFGRLIDEKGVDRLIEAAASIGGFPIKIIGDGPDLAQLKVRASSLNLSNIEFLGPMWGAELDRVLSRARFVVVPSIWHENFPYVINQSFAYGRPVIGSNRGGISELVAHGERGLIFEPDRPQDLADCIRALAIDPELAEALGRSAKAWSDALFTDEVVHTDLMKAYEAARENRRRRR